MSKFNEYFDRARFNKKLQEHYDKQDNEYQKGLEEGEKIERMLESIENEIKEYIKNDINSLPDEEPIKEDQIESLAKDALKEIINKNFKDLAENKDYKKIIIDEFLQDYIDMFKEKQNNFKK